MKIAVFTMVLVIGILLIGNIEVSAQGIVRPPKKEQPKVDHITSNEDRSGENIKTEDIRQLLQHFHYRPKVFFSCKTDIFGETEPIIINEFKREEKFDSFDIVTYFNQADLKINLEFKAEENGIELVENTKNYKAAVYASMFEESFLGGTSQSMTMQIGMSTISYKEAALTVYKKMKNDFNKRIKDCIKHHIWVKLLRDSKNGNH
ncbi:MAG: hypothetical protein J1E38_09075 [Paramuribaculum sp.]|nr:hypothetical protein [Paramuribaculum sp.]